MQRYLPLLLPVLGAVGLYLALPSGRKGAARLGGLVLALGAAFAIYLLLPWLRGFAPGTWWVVAAIVGLLAAVRVVTHKDPVYSALYFVLVVVAVAILLVLMQAEFLASALVIIYAGAILVTYVFVIMLAQSATKPSYDTQAREPFFGVLAGFILLAVICAQLLAIPKTENATGAAAPTLITAMTTALPTGIDPAHGTVKGVGTGLLTIYGVAVELAGVLLLAAMVGAIAIARRRAVSDDPALEID